MPGQISLQKTFLISIWAEGIVYGIFTCLFTLCVYINFSIRRGEHTTHSMIMFSVGALMFIIATLHLAINAYRLVTGYVNHADTTGGVIAYLGDLSSWHHVLKDGLFATQELFGDSVAIYRCWVIWNHNYRIILIPSILFLATTALAYAALALFTQLPPDTSIFSTHFKLRHWITIFYALEVVQSALITGFIAYRIWTTDRAVAPFRPDARGKLLPIVRILIESVALQLTAEFILLILYAVKNNGQYIVLETICSLVGITYTALTIRVTLQLQLRETFSQDPGLSSLDFHSTSRSSGRRRSDLTDNIILPPMSNYNLATRYDADTAESHADMHHTDLPCITPCVKARHAGEKEDEESNSSDSCCSSHPRYPEKRSFEKMIEADLKRPIAVVPCPLTRAKSL
ncbi:hypothetical protein QCA50_006857 [Cerrena zonata]|uniref:Uncharacterized protein n=1 Tax=Cerrena zonata TaxID=2478898 RepID=A0AAW0GBE9_9APHY